MKRIGWRRSKRGGPASRHPPPSPHRCSPRSGRKTPRGLRVPRSAPGSRRTSGPAHACRRSCHHSRGRSAEWVAIASRSKQPSRSRGNSPPAAVRGQRLLAAAIATIGSRQLGRRPSPSGTASQTPLVEINIALGARRALPTPSSGQTERPPSPNSSTRRAPRRQTLQNAFVNAPYSPPSSSNSPPQRTQFRIVPSVSVSLHRMPRTWVMYRTVGRSAWRGKHCDVDPGVR